MTESYVSGRWLWRMVVLVPVLTVGGVYAVSGGQLVGAAAVLVDHH